MKNKLKLSSYLLNAKLNNNCIVLFSTRTGAYTVVTKDIFIALENRDFAAIPEDLLKKLILNGIVINDNFSEYDDIKVKRDRVLNRRETDSLILNIFTTTNCNARCEYCFEKGIAKNTMSEEMAKKVCDFILKKYNSKPVYICFFGGEPLLNTTIISLIVDFLKKNNIIYHISIVTNGSLINEEMISSLQKWNIENIQITLDGINKRYELIKNYYDKKITFDSIVRNIHLLLENRLSVKIKINYFLDGIDDCIAAIDYIHNEFGNVQNLKVISNHIFGVEQKNPLEANKKEMLRLYKKLIDCGYINSLSDAGLTPIDNYCSYYGNSFVIRSDGKVFNCQHETKSNNALGDVSTDCSIQKEVSVSLPYNECKRCVLLPSCQGGCVTNRIYKKYSVCLPFKNIADELIKLIILKGSF